MKYAVRRATEEDIQYFMGNSTENGKVDIGDVRQSEEIRCFVCDGVPLMVLGLVNIPTGTDDKSVALWGLFSKGVNKHTKALVRVCKDLLFDRAGYTFYAYVDESSNKFKRFATFFGFLPLKDVEEIEGKLYRLYIKRN